MTPLDKGPATGFNAYVAAELRAERAAKQITYDKLAELTGINRRTLIRLLKAERAIDTAHLASLCEALGMDIVDLISAAERRAEAETGNVYGLQIDRDATIIPYPATHAYAALERDEPLDEGPTP